MNESRSLDQTPGTYSVGSPPFDPLRSHLHARGVGWPDRRRLSASNVPPAPKAITAMTSSSITSAPAKGSGVEEVACDAGATGTDD